MPLTTIFGKMKSYLKPEGRALTEPPSSEKKSMAAFLKEEIHQSPHILPDMKPVVAKRMLKEDAYLLPDEVLTSAGALLRKSKVQKILRMRASHRYSRFRQLQRLSDVGFTQFTLVDSNDELDCDWCKSTSGNEFFLNTDIDGLIRDNCTCEYCRCSIKPLRQ